MANDPINVIDPSGGNITTLLVTTVGGAIIGTAIDVISGNDNFKGTLIGASVGLAAGLGMTLENITIGMCLNVVNAANSTINEKFAGSAELDISTHNIRHSPSLTSSTRCMDDRFEYVEKFDAEEYRNSNFTTYEAAPPPPPWWRLLKYLRKPAQWVYKKALKPAGRWAFKQITKRPVKEALETIIEKLRAEYVKEVQNLSKMRDLLLQQGKSVEEIARTLHKARRDLGEKYKNVTPKEMRERIYQRNLKKYEDKLGPSIEWLRDNGKSWEDIIESALRPGGKDLGL